VRGSRCSALSGPVPGQQVGDPVCWVIGNAGENVGEPRPGIDVVELAGLDERVDRGGVVSARIRPAEGPVPAPDRDTAHGAFGGVVREA